MLPFDGILGLGLAGLATTPQSPPASRLPDRPGLSAETVKQEELRRGEKKVLGLPHRTHKLPQMHS